MRREPAERILLVQDHLAAFIPSVRTADPDPMPHITLEADSAAYLADLTQAAAATSEQVLEALTPSTGLSGERTMWATGPLAPHPTLFEALPACQLLTVRLTALQQVSFMSLITATLT